MKTAMAKKPPETALWARRISFARMSARTAGRKIAMAFRRFAKTSRLAPWVKLAVIGYLVKKLLSSVFSYPSFVLRLRWYSLAIRFKRCDMPRKAQSLRSKSFPVFHRTERTAPGNVF
jgi:hypothetical protein